MNSVAVDIKKVPLVGIPDRDRRKPLDDDIIAPPSLIIKPADHLKMLHEGSHVASFAHVEIVAEDGKRDYKQQRTDVLEKWHRADTFEDIKDVFVAINPLYKSSREARRTNANVSQVNWVWVDIDCGDGSPDDWAYITAMRLEKIIGQQLPEPTATVFSGRGLWLMWQIEPISPRNKISMNAWGKIITLFGEVLKPLGADGATRDPARLMRLAGSINGKSGKRVSIQRHNYKPYSIEELAERYLPATRKPSRTKSQSKPAKPKEKPTGNIKRYYTAHSLFYGRANDIERLVALRGGEMNGYRNKVLFIYAMNCLQYYKDLSSASRRVIELNETFTDPLSASEVTAIMAKINSQERWWKNATVIDWLGMTDTEQEQMETIIGGSEKKRRDRQRKQTARRSQGVQTKAERDAQRIIDKAQKLANLRKIITENPNAKNADLAGILGVSLATLKRLKSSLK